MSSPDNKNKCNIKILCKLKKLYDYVLKLYSFNIFKKKMYLNVDQVKHTFT